MLSVFDTIKQNMPTGAMFKTSVKVKKEDNEFEKKLYELLDRESIEYIKQYKIRKSYFDAYLPDYNLLLEFDGDFFHPEFLKDCKYLLQKKNFKNDIKKNELANTFGYKLLRIRESDFGKITTIKELIKEKV